ncbi:globin family protein [Paludibaculum fermentans]|uniref:globin family protein n=1 Tax=Paludibaculum fermentans TaxID=1473598 RepID=UPI003EB9D755
MTSRQKSLVQASYAALKPISIEAGVIFFHRLFAVEPSLRYVFCAPVEEQAQKLMRVIAVAVRSLDFMDNSTNTSTPGAGEHIPDAVGACLLWTLQQALGEKFTSEVREAWLSLCGLVSSTLQRGAMASLVAGRC